MKKGVPLREAFFKRPFQNAHDFCLADSFLPPPFKNTPSILPAQNCCSARSGDFPQSGKGHARPSLRKFFEKVEMTSKTLNSIKLYLSTFW